MKRLAHLSDLHIGKSAEIDRNAVALRLTLDKARVDHVVLTGDVTHTGAFKELERFWELFGDLIGEGRMTVVPGNHDRLGDDVGCALMSGPRVQTVRIDGAAILRIDSTSDHNHSLLTPHGELSDFDLAAIRAQVPPADALALAILHHHPIRLPEDSFTEWLGAKLRVTQAQELDRAVIDSLASRVKLVLHGHRHVPRHVHVVRPHGELDVFNAGSSTELCGFRIFAHDGPMLLGWTWRTTRASVSGGDADHPAA